MSEKCAECGGNTEWEQELGSAICTTCGTLSNPSQSILTSHLEHDDTSGYEYSAYWNQAQGLSTLKGRTGWAFAGQDKESRHRRNMIAMHEFIRSIASRLSSPGIAPRAQAIFDQAMSKGNYKWGRRAKLVSGAAIAIALREAGKSDVLKDIAYFIEEEFTSTSQAFRDVLELLRIKLALTDPTMHIPTLQAYCLTLLKQPPPAFPSDLLAKLKVIEPLLLTITNTATSLVALLHRLNILHNLPTPPTSCAVFILAVEAELASSLPHAGAFAQALGARMGVSQKVVMERYKTIYDAVERWIKEVPWLDGHERVATDGRSKVAKRTVVARGLKDVIQFQEQIWSRQIESQPKPTLMLEASDEETYRNSKSEYGADIAYRQTTQPHISPGDVPRSLQTAKTYTSYQRAVGLASQFLLDPVARPSPSRSKAQFDDKTLSHLLTVDSMSLTHAYTAPPTRLQALAVLRGGSSDDVITDEDLFEEGELDGLIRSEEDIKALQAALGWDQQGAQPDAEVSLRSDSSRHRTSQKRRSPVEEEEAAAGSAPKRTKRIDMDALARILDPTVSLGDNADDTSETQGDAVADVAEDEVIGEWRPLSPDPSGFDYDRYV